MENYSVLTAMNMYRLLDFLKLQWEHVISTPFHILFYKGAYKGIISMIINKITYLDTYIVDSRQTMNRNGEYLQASFDYNSVV